MPRRGDVLDGVVIGRDHNGLVLDLGLKWDGVVPLQDINNLPPTEPALKIGSRVKAMVVNPVDPDGNLIVSLALARESDDWQAAQKLLDNDLVFEGVPCAANRGGLSSHSVGFAASPRRPIWPICRVAWTKRRAWTSCAGWWDSPVRSR